MLILYAKARLYNSNASIFLFSSIQSTYPPCGLLTSHHPENIQQWPGYILSIGYTMPYAGSACAGHIARFKKSGRLLRALAMSMIANALVSG